MHLVDHATTVGFVLALVIPSLAYGSLEKSGATVAGVNSVVLSRRVVSANLARHVQ